MRRTASVLVLLVCAALLSPTLPASGEAAGAPRSVASKVIVLRDKLDTGALEYTIWGRVASPIKACTKLRGIRLHAVENGARIKTFRSKRTGAWKVVLRPADVQGLTKPVFRASVARTVVRTGSGRRVACKPASMVSVHTEVVFDNFDATMPPTVVANGHLEVEIVNRCRVGRPVVLRNVSTSRNLGSDRTDASGAWAVPFDPEATGSQSSHTYRATAGRTVVGWNGQRAACLSGRNAVVADDVPILNGGAPRRLEGIFGSR